MPDAINVDDTDPSIVYSGSWQVLTNNPLEFGGGVHSTTQAGASATITFKGTFIGSFLVYHLLNRQASPGTRLQMFCTVANGTGNETANFIFDGRTGPSLIRSSHADMSYYKDGWFDSGPVPDVDHVLTVSNGGGASDTPFQIDYFAVNGSVVLPSGTPTSSGNSALTTSTGSVSSTQSDVGIRSSSGSKRPVGAIVGGVVGGLFFIALLILVIFLYRRRMVKHVASNDDIQEREEAPRPRTMTSITPFQLDPNQTSTSPSGDSTTHFAVNTSISAAEKAPYLFSVSPPPQLSSSSSLPPTPLDTETDSLSYGPHHLSDSPPSYQA